MAAAAGGGGSSGGGGAAGRAGAAAPPSASSDAIVAIDFGTHGTGCAVILPSREAMDDPLRAADEVIVLKPGDGLGRGDKQLTALLLNPRDNALVQFGSRARKAFADLCDTPGAEPGLYFHTFKMALAPSPARARDVTRIALPAMAVAGAPHATCELMTLVKRVLEYAKSEAFDYIRSRLSRPPATLRIFWVLTVPAIWDDEGKAFMREAAVRAGLIPSPDSTQLLLALEPEAAVLASIAGMAPAARDEFRPGTRLMVVDCGGGTVDITVDEIVTVKPLTLREVAPASGGPWGATYVDKQFMGFMRDILGDKWGYVDHRAQLELLNAWEAAKMSMGGTGPDGTTIPVHEIIELINDKVGCFNKEDMATLIANFNTKRGLFGPDAVSLSRSKGLAVPARLTRSFFTNVIDKAVEHIQGMLESDRVGRVDFIVLAGGFAESKLLQAVLRSKFEPRYRIISPLRPGQVVVVGAALFALQPRAIASRVMRSTYAYLGAEPFNPAVHDERHAFTTVEGRKLVNILYPLVLKDTEVEASFAVEKRGLIPVRSDQTVIDFDIYRTAEPVTDPRTEPARMRTVAVEALADAGRNSGVLTRDKVVSLSVTIGATGRPRIERTVDLHLSFASTEILAYAVSTHSGDRRTVTMRYE